ncbi:MAG: hypothetical protein KAT77_03420 [Nanoarchaeota archaeon]|nr:hypothetical protein [Nanoarchaeota archaeon]
MDLNDAKEKVYSFFNEEFSLENFDDFLNLYRNNNYREFKQYFLKAYGDNFLKRFDNDKPLMLIVVGSIKKITEAIKLEEICAEIDYCGGILFDRGYDDEANLFYVLLGKINEDGTLAEKIMDEKTSELPKEKKSPYINLEADQTRSIEDSFYLLRNVVPREITQGLSSRQQQQL